MNSKQHGAGRQREKRKNKEILTTTNDYWRDSKSNKDNDNDSDGGINVIFVAYTLPKPDGEAITQDQARNSCKCAG